MAHWNRTSSHYTRVIIPLQYVITPYEIHPFILSKFALYVD